jgi:hypothetical protein
MEPIVMHADSLGYSDMAEVGKVEIYRDPNTRKIHVVVHGFEFSSPQTCRSHTAKALAWVRDILNAELEMLRLLPGADVLCSTGMNQTILTRTLLEALGGER